MRLEKSNNFIDGEVLNKSETYILISDSNSFFVYNGFDLIYFKENYLVNI